MDEVVSTSRRAGRQVACTVRIQADARRVFDTLTDVEQMPRWTSTMTAVHREDSGPLTVGSTVRITQPKLGTAHWRVTELAPPWSFTWVSTRPGVTTRAGHVITDADIDGFAVRVDLTIDQTGPLAWLTAPLFASLTRRYLEIEATGLKTRCESSPLPDGPGPR